MPRQAPELAMSSASSSAATSGAYVKLRLTKPLPGSLTTRTTYTPEECQAANCFEEVLIMAGGIRIFQSPGVPGTSHPMRVSGLQWAAPYDQGDLLEGHQLRYYTVEPAPPAALEEVFAKVPDREKVADMLQGNADALRSQGVHVPDDLAISELRKRRAALLAGNSG